MPLLIFLALFEVLMGAFDLRRPHSTICTSLAFFRFPFTFAPFFHHVPVLGANSARGEG